MQVYVHTSMRTTFPRRLSTVNGGELSHPLALLSEDNSPAGTFAGFIPGIILCITLLSSARVAIEAAPAIARTAATMNLFAFMLRPSSDDNDCLVPCILICNSNSVLAKPLDP